MDKLIFDIQSGEIKNEEGFINNFREDNFIEPSFYDKDEFHIYHEKFADKAYKVLVKKGGKYIGYYYAGVRENVMKMPYSAPFSNIYAKDRCKSSDMLEITKSIIKVGQYLGCSRIGVNLAPEIYNKENINTIYGALCTNGFIIKEVDINNYFDLNDFTDIDSYLQSIDRKSRQNYNRAVNNGLKFMKIDNEDFMDAYDVIRKSKEELDYPLKISEVQMKDIIDMESSNVTCFIVKKDEEKIAAAIAFDSSEDISQIIYVGDSIKYRNLRPTELLYTGMIKYFKEAGKKYIDFGNSGEDGIINSGLIDYKKSMGCRSVIKSYFEYEL